MSEGEKLQGREGEKVREGYEGGEILGRREREGTGRAETMMETCCKRGEGRVSERERGDERGHGLVGDYNSR